MGSRDKRLKLWDFTPGEVHRSFETHVGHAHGPTWQKAINEQASPFQGSAGNNLGPYAGQTRTSSTAIWPTTVPAITTEISGMEPLTSQNHDSSEAMGTIPVIREHIVVTPETCGGKPRIAGTRIQVKHIVVMHDRQGMPPEQIVSEYPHLTLAGIYSALAYYHDHRDEFNADIRAEREWYEEMKSKHPSRLQERLKARTPNASDDSISPR